MKAEDLYKPLFGRAKQRPSRRQYVWGGILCAAMAIGSAALDVSWAGAVSMGVLAIGSFRLAAKRERETVSAGERDA